MIHFPFGIVANASGVSKRVPEGFHREPKPKGVAIATDLDDGSPGAYDLPPPSKAGAVPAHGPAKDKDGKSHPNGADGSLIKGDEEWWVTRTGWAPRFGTGDPKDDEGPTLSDYETWIEGKLEDKFFGG
jgi:hypothetical protein